MAQAATMGPPLSPREIRRSGRRSAPSASTSASKSPDSDLPPRQKDSTQRPPPSSSSSARKQRLKDDAEEHADDRKHATSSTHSSTTANSTNSKGKRKKDKQRLSIDVAAEPPQEPVDDKTMESVEEEEQGITRCVCGSNGEDETDAGEFMVQCETCKVWQHGLCMGYESEDQVHDADYYCEQCKPEMHQDLLKKLAKKARQSTSSHAATASRVSRSHSPTHFKQPSKRRNTMNSRDAAFDESIKEIIEATAAEAAAVHESTAQVVQTGSTPQDIDEDVDHGSTNKRKRKRTEDDSTSKKRTRSASSASDHPPTMPRPPTPPPKPIPQPTSTAPTKPPARNKRIARKNATAEAPASVDGDETPAIPPATTKRQGGNGRSKGSSLAKRPPISHSNSHGNSNNSMSHEQGPRRGQAHNTNGQGGSALESSRAYRNSHAYAVSQQPLFTSWGLPDHLAHLEEMLPTDTPQPLEIGAIGGGRESIERSTERGVKVKWPSKRMSVGDMNKRVRALVEWVGREQANALDRERRRGALEKALDYDVENTRSGVEDNGITTNGASGPKVSESEHELRGSLWKTEGGKPMSTMKTMEELMEELIGFQEKFGPGAKTRERERRTGPAS